MTPQGRVALGGLLLAGACTIALAAMLGRACSQMKKGMDEVAAAQSADAARAKAPLLSPKPAQPTIIEQVLATPKRTDVMPLLSFKDTHNEWDPGAMLLGAWATQWMVWGNVDAEETTSGRVMKDPDAERGRRACWRGTIDEIHVDRSGIPYGAGVAYLGGLSTANLDFVRFVAVRSTGDLVANSPARFCGIVTGIMSFENALGTNTRAVVAVGMFDLPENRKAPPPADPPVPRSPAPPTPLPKAAARLPAGPAVPQPTSASAPVESPPPVATPAEPLPTTPIAAPPF